MMFEVIALGLGVITNQHVCKHINAYYVKFDTGTVTAVPVVIEVKEDGKTVRRLKFSTTGVELFGTNKEIELVIE